MRNGETPRTGRGWAQAGTIHVEADERGPILSMKPRSLSGSGFEAAGSFRGPSWKGVQSHRQTAKDKLWAKALAASQG